MQICPSVQIHEYIHKHIYVYTYIYTNVYTYICIHLYTFICTCFHVCMSHTSHIPRTCTCTLTRTCTYTLTHTHTHTHTHAQVLLLICLSARFFFPGTLSQKNSISRFSKVILPPKRLIFDCWVDEFMREQFVPELLSCECQPRMGPLGY